MPKFFVKTSQIKEENIYINGTDFNHISNVLRLKVGEQITIGNMDTGENYLCEILKFDKEKVTTKIIEKLKEQKEIKLEIHILQGIPKSDKMELIIQKSVELGVSKIIPIQMDRSIVKLNEKDEKKKNDRWNKIAESAAKQCERDIIPEVSMSIKTDNIETIKNDYDIIIVAYEKEENNTIKDVLKEIKKKNKPAQIAIIIGPEGGISDREIQLLENMDAKIVTIGKRILRTETVALAISSMIVYEFEL